MNSAASFNLVDFDDGPTLVQASPVFHTQVMDRRQLPLPPAAAAQPSPDATHPALRVRRDLAGTRRLVVGLAIGLAFTFGLAGAFAFQTVNATAAPAPVIARAPRSLTDRSSTLDTRSTPDAVPRAPETPRPKRVTPARPAPAANDEPSTSSASETLEGRDLLGEGLGD